MCVDVYGVMGGIDGGLLVVSVGVWRYKGIVNVYECTWCNWGGGKYGGLLVVGVINDVSYGSVNVYRCTWCNGGN